MEPKKTAIQNIIKQNATNMILYEDSFVKTAFFTKEILNWERKRGEGGGEGGWAVFVRAVVTPTPKNLTLFYCQENDSFRKDLKSVIEKISSTKSLVIIDSLNGFFNLLEGKKDIGRLINSFLMLLVSSAKHTKSTVMVGILSKLNDENKPILYNTGRRVIENAQFAKIQLTGSGNNTLVEALNSGE